ncbi:MAG: sensor histidine kinase [Firmicutes bacterium]|nr:sensor histidine kinase [Bacillota bacterium]
MDINLFVQLLERMALIALAAYIYNQTHLFRNMVKDELTVKDKAGMILFFSTLSIIGTYTGVGVEPFALANTRPIGAFMAGYMGGPVMGILVGAIAGGHRYTFGGFTATACAVATIAEGLMGAAARKYSKDRGLSVGTGFIGALLAEMLQMLIVLTIARPLEASVELVKIIGLPMIIINSLGVAVFILIIKNAKEDFARIGAVQSQKVLNIAGRTINYLRNGLDRNTAGHVAEIICEIGDVEAAFVADGKELLAYNGDLINEEILNKNLNNYYKDPGFGTITFVNGEKKILFYCVPIYGIDSNFEGVIGHQLKSEKILRDGYFANYAKELSGLLSTQVEIHKLNVLAHEAYVAEFRALRAQIEPHFLFNALNTIASFCRTNPVRARELIIDLSNYFRQTLNRREDFVTLEREINFLNSYLSIEKARFGDRLVINIDIPEGLENAKMPAFVLQPLVENSIKHGILPKAEGGTVTVKAESLGDIIGFSVVDDGVGMNMEKVEEITTFWPGIGLDNVNERLKIIYPNFNGLEISSAAGSGTKVSFRMNKEVMETDE